ncbi:hypothetical protein DPMN_156177 [Dreissena polymorpha]|uniref:Uncharacterized protein n=1 Tax=Dreissena polymorpha TaxID=45954 RepID=A0A9D4FRT9_DREPO|nr:hypothetical protein DPMN_156177 [Dreissena polymorpha]
MYSVGELRELLVHNLLSLVNASVARAILILTSAVPVPSLDFKAIHFFQLLAENGYLFTGVDCTCSSTSPCCSPYALSYSMLMRSWSSLLVRTFEPCVPCHQRISSRR